MSSLFCICYSEAILVYLIKSPFCVWLFCIPLFCDVWPLIRYSIVDIVILDPHYRPVDYYLLSVPCCLFSMMLSVLMMILTLISHHYSDDMISLRSGDLLFVTIVHLRDGSTMLLIGIATCGILWPRDAGIHSLFCNVVRYCAVFIVHPAPLLLSQYHCCYCSICWWPLYVLNPSDLSSHLIHLLFWLCHSLEVTCCCLWWLFDGDIVVDSLPTLCLRYLWHFSLIDGILNVDEVTLSHLTVLVWVYFHSSDCRALTVHYDCSRYFEVWYQCWAETISSIQWLCWLYCSDRLIMWCTGCCICCAYLMSLTSFPLFCILLFSRVTRVCLTCDLNLCGYCVWLNCILSVLCVWLLISLFSTMLLSLYLFKYLNTMYW